MHLESRFRYTVHLGSLERDILGREDYYPAVLVHLQLSLETKLLGLVPSCGFRFVT